MIFFTFKPPKKLDTSCVEIRICRVQLLFYGIVRGLLVYLPAYRIASSRAERCRCAVERGARRKGLFLHENNPSTTTWSPSLCTREATALLRLVRSVSFPRVHSGRQDRAIAKLVIFTESKIPTSLPFRRHSGSTTARTRLRSE